MDESGKGQVQGLKFGQTRSHAIILYDSVPADSIGRVVSTKSEEIMHQKTSIPASASQTYFEEAWQVQRDDYFQRASGIGKPVADEKKFKVDLRVQGVPQKAVCQDEDRTERIRRLAHTLWNKRSKEKVLIRDLQETDTFDPFCEESKKIIHNMGNVEYFELCEVSAKTQCSSCAACWPDGVVCCPCGHLRKIRLMTKEKFDLLSAPFFIKKKGAFCGARHEKSEEQCDHHQAKMRLRMAKNKQFESILDRFQKQDSHCEPRMAIG